MEQLLNHLELCHCLYQGNTNTAIELFTKKTNQIPLTGMFAYKTYLSSLNLGIYNYILNHETISLHKTCLENEELIRTSNKDMILEIGKSIILAYSYDKNYLIEKHKNPHIKYAVRYIHEHLSDKLTLAQVGQAISINSAYLSDLFHKETGVNFLQYITLQRMNLAKALLRHTDLSIAEIAVNCGYKDAAYFSSAFKKQEGVSPSRLRKSH